MSAREPLPALPREIRDATNWKLRDVELSALDDNARFIVRRMVGDAYVRGFDAGWFAGQSDADTDRSIKRDQPEGEQSNDNE